MWQSHLHRLIADWLGLMEPARSRSCPSPYRRGPTAPGADSVPSRVQEYFYTSASPTSKTVIPRVDVASHGVETPHRLIADGLGLMKLACGESFLSGQRQGPATPRDGNTPSPGQKPFYIPGIYNPNILGTKTVIHRVDTAPHGVQTPTRLVDC